MKTFITIMIPIFYIHTFAKDITNNTSANQNHTFHISCPANILTDCQTKILNTLGDKGCIISSESKNCQPVENANNADTTVPMMSCEFTSENCRDRGQDNNNCVILSVKPADSIPHKFCKIIEIAKKKEARKGQR